MEEKKRLMSIDALRGFDMFFITGGAALITALCSAFDCPSCWLAVEMRHVPWEGFAHHDTIFPLFLFLAGASWPFSLASQQEKGRSALSIHAKVIRRMLALFFIEVTLGGLMRFNPNFRLMGVLSFIGISWGLAAIVFMHVRKFSNRAITIAALLIGYWACLQFLIAPDAVAGADSYSKEWNIVSYLDRTIWPNHLLKRGVYEPESLFSIAGGIALALTGMCSGAWLKSGASAPRKKAGVLALAALGLFILDMVFVHLMGCKIVKALWTPSFVLSAATYSTALLALFYWLIDVRGLTRWTFYFRIIGMNSIFIYLMMRLGLIWRLSDYLFEGVAKWVGSPWTAVVSQLGALAFGWMILYALYRKNVFLRV